MSNIASNNVFLVDGTRTPLGSFMGSLAHFTAVDLGTEVVKALVERNDLPSDVIDEVFWGNVCSANLGQSPARQIILKGGLSNRTPATMVNKVCSSSLKALSLGADTIALKSSEMVLAGGMESMSQVPHYLINSRKGVKLGDGKIIDGVMKDGLSDAYQNVAMGVFADKTAEKYNITRKEQDEWARLSYERALKANEEGFFKKEITPLRYQDKKGKVVVIAEDEEIKRGDFTKAPN